MGSFPSPTKLPRLAILRRHVLSALLVLLYLAEVARFLTIYSWGAVAHKLQFAIHVLALCAAANIYFLVKLFRWRRRGFYGFVLFTAIAVATNCVAKLDQLITSQGMISVAWLFSALHTGKVRNEWSYFK